LIKKSTNYEGNNCANNKANNSFEDAHYSGFIICLKDREDTEGRKHKGKNKEKEKSM
jgi:hypothetical protein